MNQPRLHLACSTDAKYMPHVATLIESLAASNFLPRITFHLLHDESVTIDLRDKLRVACERHKLDLEFIQPPNSLLDKLPSAAACPPVIWYRIFLPELLGSLDRILYLDADTLVLQDLQSLWGANLNDCLFGAVAHPPVEGTGIRVAKLGLPANAPYLNSGVLLMNLKKMREEGFSGRMAEIAKLRAKDIIYPVIFPDQDAYNLVGAGQWLRLHPKWNCFAWFFLARGNDQNFVRNNMTYCEAVASPAILHFEGGIFAKPWNYRCVHPHRHLYLTYRQRTPWPLHELEGISMATRILKYFPVHQQLRLAQVKRFLSLTQS